MIQCHCSIPYSPLIKTLQLTLPSIILNIGGISNLTYWDGKKLIGFDTGPGNALMDDYSSAVFDKNFDKFIYRQANSG